MIYFACIYHSVNILPLRLVVPFRCFPARFLSFLSLLPPPISARPSPLCAAASPACVRHKTVLRSDSIYCYLLFLFVFYHFVNFVIMAIFASFPWPTVLLAGNRHLSAVGRSPVISLLRRSTGGAAAPESANHLCLYMVRIYHSRYFFITPIRSVNFRLF